MKGIILVGGPSTGTRFRPLSMDLPKPLFPVAGSPMIYHHVSALSKVNGMNEIILIGFFEQQIFERFLSDVQQDFPDIHFKYLREYKSLGTGGGIYHFRDEILRGNPKKIFVLNADIASSFPLNDMLNFMNSKAEQRAAILTTKVDADQTHKYGTVVVDEVSNVIVHYVEKPTTFISDIISCGVYLFDPSIFDAIKDSIDVRREELESGKWISNEDFPNNQAKIGTQAEKVRLEHEVLSVLVSARKVVSFPCNPKKDFWMQIKAPTSAIPANGLYLQHFRKNAPRKLTATSPAYNNADISAMLDAIELRDTGAELIQPVVIHPSANVHPSAKLGPNVSIGPGVYIGKGVRIINSLILGKAEIKASSCVMNSIVGWDSKIGTWCRVEGAPGDASHLNATFKGLKIPAATILGGGVTIADELVVRNCIVLPHKELKQSYHNEILM